MFETSITIKTGHPYTHKLWTVPLSLEEFTIAFLPFITFVLFDPSPFHRNLNIEFSKQKKKKARQHLATIGKKFEFKQFRYSIYFDSTGNCIWLCIYIDSVNELIDLKLLKQTINSAVCSVWCGVSVNAINFLNELKKNGARGSGLMERYNLITVLPEVRKFWNNSRRYKTTRDTTF